MKKYYIGLWALLAGAFVLFAALSSFDSIQIDSFELKSSNIIKTLTAPTTEGSGVTSAAPGSANSGATSTSDAAKPSTTHQTAKPVPTDTLSKTILFIGDSMLEGLSPRLAAYATANGHTLYSVIWYSSTSEIWGGSGKLAGYIQRLRPDFIFICLGANELFVKDIAQKRDKYVKQLVKEIGNIPFVWIGPPNWKEDTGINNLIAANVPQGSFFLSNGMHFDRSKDGAHPTRQSAILWMDSVARWMPLHSNHPIKMNKPKESTGRAKKIFVHQPSER